MSEEQNPGRPAPQGPTPNPIENPPAQVAASEMAWVDPNTLPPVSDERVPTPQAAARAEELRAAAPAMAAETGSPVSPSVVSETFQTPVRPAARSGEDAEATMRRMSRRSFLWAGAAVAGTYVGWHWLKTRPEIDGIGWPFRRALEVNEQFAKDYFTTARLLPTFDPSQARDLRENGFDGMPDVDPDVEEAAEFDPKEWQLTVYGLASPPETSSSDSSDDSKKTAPSASSDKHKETEQVAANAKQATGGGENADTSDTSSDSDSSDTSSDSSGEQALTLTLDDIKKLPRVTQTVEFKCIEGWSEIVTWTGARMIDFLAKYGPQTKSGDPPNVLKKPHDLLDYVSMETPDGGYYVGLDMPSVIHPQTLLCYEMNGKPLTIEHGAPLRLIIPVKYGVKNIKRIGTIRFTAQRPRDYWAEQGYDWYAGH